MLFLVSAADRHGLAREVAALSARAAETDATSLAALALRHARHAVRASRLAVIATNRRDLRAKLERAHALLVAGEKDRLRMRTGLYYGVGEPHGGTALLFPGQGSQHHGMLDEVYQRWPSARAWFDALDAAYLRAGEAPPSELLRPNPDVAGEAGDEIRRSRERELYAIDRGAQLLVFASLASYETLRDLGVVADVMAGHSNGEHATFLASGAISFRSRDQLCDTVYQWARSSRELPPPGPEGMLALSSFDRRTVEAMVARWPGALFLAMDNCPSQIVLAGLANAIDEVESEIARAGFVVSRLPFEHAYHTPLFAEWARALRAHYEHFDVATPHTPVLCSATGRMLPPDPAAVRDLLAAQWVSSVRFRDLIEQLHARGVRTFIEVGPDNRLTSFVEDTLRGKPHLAVPAASRHRSDSLQLKHLAGELYALGLPIRVEVLDRFDAALSGSLPASRPEDVSPAPRRRTGGARAELMALHEALGREAAESDARIRALLQRPTQKAARVAPLATGVSARRPGPFLGEIVRSDSRSLEAVRHFDINRDPLLREHSLGPLAAQHASTTWPLPVLPFTLSLELVAEAAASLGKGVTIALTEARGRRWLALDRGRLTVGLRAERMPNGPIRVELYEIDGATRHLAFEGTAHVAASYPPAPPPSFGARPPQPPRHTSVSNFYTRFAFHGPAFQGIERLRSLDGEHVEADLVPRALPELDGAALELDPALLDCTGQLAALSLLEQGERGFGLFPFELRSLAWYAPRAAASERLRCRGEVRRDLVGNTDSRFELLDERGALRLRMDGFRQRFLRYPPRFADVLFGHGPSSAGLSKVERVSDEGIASSMAPPDDEFLTSSWGIWARALAHVALDRRELDAWYERSTDLHARAAELVDLVAIKECARRWAALRGLDLPLTAIQVHGDLDARPLIAHPAFDERGIELLLDREGGVTTAVVAERGRARALLRAVRSREQIKHRAATAMEE